MVLRADPAQFAGCGSVSEAVRRCAVLLSEHGVGTPHLDARVLGQSAFGLDHAGLILNGDRSPEPSGLDKLVSFTGRRLRGEPVSRILGQREFYGLELMISPAVLDPRPETETLIEAAAALWAGRREEALRIVDLGTGSGAIVLALLSLFPNAAGLAVDSSADALDIAAANARRLGLESRLRLKQSDWLGAIDEEFDLAVANPPYIETAEIPILSPEVRDFDPAAALDGGADGLTAYRSLAAQICGALTPGGIALFEIGSRQSGAVIELMQRAGLVTLPRPGPVFKDLAGLDRVVGLRRPLMTIR